MNHWIDRLCWRVTVVLILIMAALMFRGFFTEAIKDMAGAIAMWIHLFPR